MNRNENRGKKLLPAIVCLLLSLTVLPQPADARDDYTTCVPNVSNGQYTTQCPHRLHNRNDISRKSFNYPFYIDSRIIFCHDRNFMNRSECFGLSWRSGMPFFQLINPFVSGAVDVFNAVFYAGFGKFCFQVFNMRVDEIVVV